ncbi:Reverse transcriptase zinc-binding domain - like 10 [Theobroma cacao]|nr:Reverse transcriptase zinc-binding domain - like 10 [Theobroma cacao]
MQVQPFFGFVLGNGENIRFWSEKWIEDFCLKEHFPRIYALANNKCGTVKEFGTWENGIWEWKVKLRRQVFGWEHKQYDSFNDTINEFFLCENMKDELVWKKTASGEFTVKSFCQNYVELRRENQREWKWVWGGYAPHKTETLVWQLMHGKAAVKGELVKRGIISATEALCPLCKDSIETVDHLFVGCISVKSLWYAWCKEWGFAWVMPTRFKELMTMWNAINVKASCDKIWRMAVFAITWTIWIGRNEVVFNNKVWDKELIWELIKLRVATWADARWQSNSRSILDLYRYPVESYNQQKDRGQRPQTV